MRALLVVNLLLGALAFFFHGAVLVVYLFSAAGLLANYWFLFPVVAFEALLVVLSVIGLLGDQDRARVCLKVQSVIFGGFGIIVLGLLLRELPFGTTPGSGFWVPILGSGFIAYCVYLLVRAYPKAITLKAAQAALLSGSVVFLVELIVVLR